MAIYRGEEMRIAEFQLDGLIEKPCNLVVRCVGFQCHRRAISVAAQRPDLSRFSPVSISQFGKSQLADFATRSSADCMQLGSAEPAHFSAVELVRTSSVHRSRVTDLAMDV